MPRRSGLRVLAATALLALGGCGAVGADEPPAAAKAAAQVETIDAATLAAMRDRGEVTLIDVRTPEEFAESHIDGAVNMPLDGFDPAAVPQDAGRETILYCRSGRRSGIAAEQLATATGGTVRHLSGGILAWQAEDRAVLASGKEPAEKCC